MVRIVRYRKRANRLVILTQVCAEMGGRSKYKVGVKVR